MSTLVTTTGADIPTHVTTSVTARDNLEYRLTHYWDQTRRLTITRADTTVFSCLVTTLATQSLLITDCLPQRDHPDTADLLAAACRHLVTDHAAPGVIAIHPRFWDTRMAAEHARQLQLVVPMHLKIGAQELPPADHEATPWDTDGNPDLTALEDTPGVWEEALRGDFGRPIPEATLAIHTDGEPAAAIMVTLFHGVPFLANLTTAPASRGQGLGRALLIHSMAALDAAGYVECHLNVAATNESARALYESIGFTQARPTQRVSFLRAMG